nr:uracil-DNA glycosylase [Telmatocola sphagniphila]
MSSKKSPTLHLFSELENPPETPSNAVAQVPEPAEEPEPSIPLPSVHSSWLPFFRKEFSKPYMAELRQFVADERKQHAVYPPAPEVFQAFQLTGLADLKVLVLGQDPYHGEGQAHGLSFSVKPGVKPPPSLVNIFKELMSDLGIAMPKNGYLKSWAEQGVMMLNAVLTVRANTPTSHKDRGWETFTDAAIEEINRKVDPVIFVLWGAYAQKKGRLIDAKKHHVLKSAHPSPFSADSGFFGSRPFSQINKLLEKEGKTPIEWGY